jgi:CBS domain-containing protein
VATLEPVTCAPGDDLETAMGLMRQHEVQRLPVVDDGEIVGVISFADIAFGRPDEERGGLDPER